MSFNRGVPRHLTACTCYQARSDSYASDRHRGFQACYTRKSGHEQSFAHAKAMWILPTSALPLVHHSFNTLRELR